MTDVTFDPKANDELICLILRVQHLINARTLYRQNIAEQLTDMFQPNEGQIICPITEQALEDTEYAQWLGQFKTEQTRLLLGEVVYVAIGTVLQLWDLEYR